MSLDNDITSFLASIYENLYFEKAGLFHLN